MPSESERFFDVLLQGLCDPDPLVQADAARHLGEFGDARGVDPLLEYVATSRHNTKTAGIEALLKIGAPRAAEGVRPLVESPNVQDDWYWYARRSVRAAAALALLHWDDETGVSFLESLADAGDLVFFAWYAPSVLRLPDNPDSAKRLKSRLTPATLLGDEGPARKPTDPAQTVMVAEALEVIGTANACAALLELLDHHSRYVRGRAATALLAAAATKEHIGRVVRCFETDPTDFARIKSAAALTRAGRREHTRFLAEAARSAGDPFDRAVAIESLGELRLSDYADAALAGAADPDDYVRMVSLEALSRMGAGEVADAATRALEVPSPRVRLQAAACLAAQFRTNDQ